ncbi:unnamed protein product [Ixodes pacificus]
MRFRILQMRFGFLFKNIADVVRMRIVKSTQGSTHVPSTKHREEVSIATARHGISHVTAFAAVATETFAQRPFL